MPLNLYLSDGILLATLFTYWKQTDKELLPYCVHAQITDRMRPCTIKRRQSPDKNLQKKRFDMKSTYTWNEMIHLNSQ